jgi:hypothetical protein
MESINLDFTRGIYKRVKINELSWNYKLISIDGKHNELLTEEVKIEHNEFRHRPNSYKFKYWLILKNKKAWSKSDYKSGIVRAETSNNIIYYWGDIPEFLNLENRDLNEGKEWRNPKHLFLLQFNEVGNELVLDLFKDFYPVRKNLRITLINQHIFYFHNTQQTEFKELI